MSLLDWIFGRTRKADEPPPMPVQVIHAPAVPPPAMDEVAEEIPTEANDGIAAQQVQQSRIEQVNPAVFAMDYTDSTGRKSRRRVKLLGVTNHTSPAWMNAICFEKQKVRNFRIDRIDRIISLHDGSIHDASNYLTQVAGVPPELLGRVKDPVLAHARRIFDQMRAPLSILVLAALEDGTMHPKEIEAIMEYARKELLFLVRQGWAEKGNKTREMTIIRDMIVTLRPDRADLQAYVKTLREWESDRRISHLTEALAKVVHADGHVTAKEMNFLHAFNSFGAS